MRRLTGSGVVTGVGVGHAVLLVRRGRALRAPVSAGRVEDEIRRLDHARDLSRQQLAAIGARLSDGPGADLAALFDAQLLMLDDPLLLGRATTLVREERVNAEWAVQRAFEEVAGLFEGIGDAYLRERGGDVADLVGRLRMNLRGGARGWRDVLAQGDGPFVIVADDPPPSVAAQVDWSAVVGLAIDAGSRTSHTAILARSLGIPTVVGLRTATSLVSPGMLVALDGAAGELLLAPEEQDLAPLRQREASRAPVPVAPRGRTPAVTRDGVRVRLEANVDRIEDVEAALAAGADGTGLFRSEFLLLGGTLPGLIGPASEARQEQAYRSVAEALAPAPVTIRTFDLDEAQADALSSISSARAEIERHRPLGVRGIRLGLARPAMLETQFRAILGAARAGNVRILLPFVTSAGELLAARRLLEKARADLCADGLGVPAVPLGAMIEVPAAALTADLLGPHADFLAVGTNDLMQYLLAVDRTDERVAALADPFHPALVRVLRRLARLASRGGLALSVCGELASDPVMLALLVGFGVREFSMTPSALGAAWRVLVASDSRELAAAARAAATSGSLAPVESYVMQAAGAPTPRLALGR
jgi:phosphoenolpyruvate-protein phosphotransferase (PTS system enzyme I)